MGDFLLWLPCKPTMLKVPVFKIIDASFKSSWRIVMFYRSVGLASLLAIITIPLMYSENAKGQGDAQEKKFEDFDKVVKRYFINN